MSSSSASGTSTFLITLENYSWNILSSPARSSQISGVGLVLLCSSWFAEMNFSLNCSTIRLFYASNILLHWSVCASKLVTLCALVRVMGMPLEGKNQ